MKESLYSSLETYRAFAKKESAETLSLDDAELIDCFLNLDEAIEKIKLVYKTSTEAQQQIYALQQKKQEVVHRLKGEIARLDDPDYEPVREKDAHFVFQKDDKLYTQIGNENPLEVTKGDLMTDGQWGVKYALDPTSVPRNLQKRYLIEEAKREIKDYLD